MGGPGSGRRPRAIENVVNLGDLTRLSRVQLEPMLARALSISDYDAARAIWAELGSRTWQHTNPYADPLPTP